MAFDKILFTVPAEDKKDWLELVEFAHEKGYIKEAKSIELFRLLRDQFAKQTGFTPQPK